MNSVGRNQRYAIKLPYYQGFAAFVAVAIGLIVLAPFALQGLTALRAAQYETNENRSEIETNTRLHSSVQPARSANRHSASDIVTPSMRRLECRNSIQRALAEIRHRIPQVVVWSPLMRC
jgi:hypothetical protein